MSLQSVISQLQHTERIALPYKWSTIYHSGHDNWPEKVFVRICIYHLNLQPWGLKPWSLWPEGSQCPLHSSRSSWSSKKDIQCHEYIPIKCMYVYLHIHSVLHEVEESWGETNIFVYHVFSLMWLLQWRRPQVSNGHTAAPRQSDEENQFASTMVQTGREQLTFVHLQPGYVNFTPEHSKHTSLS